MLDRAALRLAAVMALTNGMATPYPTMAFDRVFDSRMDPLQAAEDIETIPVALVYTDDTDREGLSDNNGGAYGWRSHANLVIELSIGDFKADEKNPELQPIQSDPALEIMLDTFEEQVHRSLFHPTNVWAIRFQEKSVVRVESWNSQRFVDRDSNVRLASRQIIARCLLKQPDENSFYDSLSGDPTPTSSIPEPLGTLIDDIIAAGGDYAPTVQNMKDLIDKSGGALASIDLPTLERIRFIEGDAGGGFRPDGIAEETLT